MRKFVFVMFLGLIVISLLGLNNEKSLKKNYTNKDRDLGQPPSYNFSISPINLGETLYDYMPGSYRNLPVRVQPETTSTGLPADGVYIVYHKQENQNSSRAIYYSYIDNLGNLNSSGLISEENRWAGYPSVAIDNITADPIAVWHTFNDTGEYFPRMTWSDFANSPSDWLNNFYDIILPDSLSIPDDEFVWPNIKIGHSPNQGKRRLYISSTNSNPTEPIQLLAFADFDENNLENNEPESWNWHYQIMFNPDLPEGSFMRYSLSMAVKDNYIAFVGHYVISAEQLPEDETKIIALVNDNYGEGEFESYVFDYRNQWEISDVQKTDGHWLYGDDSPAQLRWDGVSASTHFNAIFTDDETISFPLAFSIYKYDEEASFWSTDYSLAQMYVKSMKFNVDTYEFTVEDVYPPDLSSTPNNQPVIPWDLDGNGEVDEYDESGTPVWPKSLPIWNSEEVDEYIHQNYLKITQNNQEHWQAIVWSDSYESFMASQGVEEYADWTGIPKIMIATKFDGNWNAPIEINAKTDDENYNQEIEGMRPCYLYPGDKIEKIDDNIGKLHLFFLNKNGTIPSLQYTALNIDWDSSEGHEDIVENIQSVTINNYPNPFNPQTTIYYIIPKDTKNAKLEIYNLKGQKVRRININSKKSENNSVVWNGKSDDGKAVSSGVYFYSLNIDGKIKAIKKCVLMK